VFVVSALVYVLWIVYGYSVFLLRTRPP